MLEEHPVQKLVVSAKSVDLTDAKYTFYGPGILSDYFDILEMILSPSSPLIEFLSKVQRRSCKGLSRRPTTYQPPAQGLIQSYKGLASFHRAPVITCRD